jgi:hypothetical protein
MVFFRFITQFFKFTVFSKFVFLDCNQSVFTFLPKSSFGFKEFPPKFPSIQRRSKRLRPPLDWANPATFLWNSYVVPMKFLCSNGGLSRFLHSKGGWITCSIWYGICRNTANISKIKKQVVYNWFLNKATFLLRYFSLYIWRLEAFLSIF